MIALALAFAGSLSVLEPPQVAPPQLSVVRASQTEAARFQDWLVAFRGRARAAGIRADVLDAALGGVTYNPKIIALDRRQSDFTKTIRQYLSSAISNERIAGGRRALARYKTALAQIEQTYGVDKEVVVAIWGLETSYGGFRGRSSTIRSLATLAFDARRSAFFEAELIAALRIIQSGDIAPRAMLGSWAGAMGHTQFMPSSYLAHAVDFDGDGRRGIWSDTPVDALASTAAYLRHFGWKRGVPWAVEVQVPAGFDLSLANPATRKPARTWARLGIAGAERLSGRTRAALYLPAGADGPALLVTGNFDALQKYNITPTYVMSVGGLFDQLRGGSGLRAPWPPDARLLSLAERKDMQARLRAAGFDPRRLDGKVDARFIAAVQAYQAARGLPPDGYPSPALLARLRAGQ